MKTSSFPFSPFSLFAPRSLARLLSVYLIAAVGFLGVAQSAQAAMIGSEQALASTSGERERLLQMLDRADVIAKFEEMGVSAADARARVATLSDSEAAYVAENIEAAPAGGIIGAIIFVFLVLLLTDILGFTKIFPFTRPIR
jgi:hypothetical protein